MKRSDCDRTERTGGSEPLLLTPSNSLLIDAEKIKFKLKDVPSKQ